MGVADITKVIPFIGVIVLIVGILLAEILYATKRKMK